jgi:6,7-dimethyl-8-ribityllumazine synthase
MLRAQKSQPVYSAEGLRFAVVASRYNRRYADALAAHATRTLRKAGAARDDVQVVRVPGGFEIPVVVDRLAGRGGYDAIIALGVIIRGETAHADLIGGAITRQLAEIAVRHGVPVIHEVLLLANEQQAEARCVRPAHNRGTEAALTAIEMARLIREL